MTVKHTTLLCRSNITVSLQQKKQKMMGHKKKVEKWGQVTSNLF